MYSTCLFCNQSLGKNEVLEEFPVGRRIAFDGAKGRLWVVCRRCERWNLAPLEERWEVIEECERLFRGTRMRVSTENIGLARLAEGLELVRIGPALRPEFAAWRYGDQFGRRRRRAILYGVGGVTVLTTLVIGGLFAGAAYGAVLGQSGNIANLIVNARTVLKLRTEDGKVIKLRGMDIYNTVFLPGQNGEPWRVAVGTHDRRRVFEGLEAQRVAGLVLPKVNSGGGSRATVQEAVRQIEEAGGPEAFITSDLVNPLTAREYAASGRLGPMWRTRRGPAGEPTLRVGGLPRPTRLALEMALHEEAERRAMEGELEALEAAWREAEEIAAIADNLLLPPHAEEFIERHRAEATAGEPEKGAGASA